MIGRVRIKELHRKVQMLKPLMSVDGSNGIIHLSNLLPKECPSGGPRWIWMLLFKNGWLE